MERIKHIEVNLGKACNNRCIFCMAHTNDWIGFANTEEVKKEIKSCSKQGFNSIGFLGGEPTIHQEIASIVSYAKNNGFKKIHMVSNGRMYSDKEFLKKLIRAGVTRFSVSIHSHIPKIEDELTQVKGGFYQKIKGLKNLVSCQHDRLIKENISINIVINKKNYRNLIGTLSFFMNLGLKEFRLNFIRPEGRAWYNFEKLVPRYSDFVPYIQEILDFADEKKIGVTISDIPYCMFSNIKHPLNFTGKSRDYFDSVVSFGNNYEKGIPTKQKFSWNKMRKNQLKIKKGSCSYCIYNLICEGPWRNYVRKFGFGEFKPILKQK